ncbi:MAG: indole-3-glycerol phosphate synthase TrpC [Sedimentisphaerales bacterium]|nr:indole-3-glycerol phosphate synthase TrpC [Sedimentisphaerales bacterium]
MGNFLEQVLAEKRKDLEVRKQKVPLEQLKAGLDGLPRCRNFYKAVTKPNPRGVNVIAEVKRASPSAGLIRADFDPVQIAMTYQRCGADAISVITDGRYFQGSIEYLTAVKQAVTLPVLFKDFIIDPYQVYEARLAGADAVLLIAEALNLSQLADLLILASQLTLTVLLEVHGPDVLLNVRSLIGFPIRGFSVLGINNRDLTSLQVDTNTFCRLAALVDPAEGLVAESGIKTRHDVQRMVAAGATAVLVGQALCQDQDIEAQFIRLFGPVQGDGG